METDPAGRFEQIRGALDAAGLEFDNMSYYQRKFFTESLGLGDVGDLAMLMSGNINDLAGSTNQSAEELIAMKEKSQEVMNVTEAFRAIIADNTEAFIAFAEAMSDGVRFIQEHAGTIIHIAKLYGAFRFGMAAFNTVQKIRNGLQKKTVGSIEE
ncbi:MAG TPA: hypothetical protein DF712_16410, partial [Balneola sp.]|nr:hypothetical protein [Balneola sp.]